MIGLFDLPAPAFDLLDGWLAPVMPSGLRIVLWGAIAGAATMLLYWAFSPQARIAQVKRELGRAKRDLDAYDGAFADAAPLIRRMLGQALRQVGLVLGPALASGLPVLCLIAWLSGAFGHAYPPPAEAVEVRVTPPVLQAQWRGTESEMPEGAAPGLAAPQEPKPAPAAGRAATGPAAKQKAEVVVTDERGGPVEWLTLEAPVPVLHKWIWWNLLLANPAGYLPDDGPVERVEIALPRQEHFTVGPSWARGWELGFFLSLMLTALGAKFAFRIQ